MINSKYVDRFNIENASRFISDYDDRFNSENAD